VPYIAHNGFANFEVNRVCVYFFKKCNSKDNAKKF
jgi:hypothetical protein